MAFVPERPAPGASHSAYLETKDAIYHLISCIEGLLPRITTRRERLEVFELMGRLETMLVDVMITEELDEAFDATPPQDTPPRDPPEPGANA